MFSRGLFLCHQLRPDKVVLKLGLWIKGLADIKILEEVQLIVQYTCFQIQGSWVRILAKTKLWSTLWVWARTIKLKMMHSHPNIWSASTTAKQNCLTLFWVLFGTTRKGEVTRLRLRTLSNYITKNRIKRTSGPVHSPITYIDRVWLKNPLAKILQVFIALKNFCESFIIWCLLHFDNIIATSK